VVAGAGALFVVWVVLAGTGPVDLAVGVVAAVLAAVAGRALSGTPAVAVSWRRFAGLLLRLPAQIVVAGTDVALRALARPPRIAPGILDHDIAVPPGPARNLFRLLSSLQPGSLPVGDGAGGGLVVHHLVVEDGAAGGVEHEAERFRYAVREVRS
jgi:multicomponent Na+:H+ antiporter subunit E